MNEIIEKKSELLKILTPLNLSLGLINKGYLIGVVRGVTSFFSGYFVAKRRGPLDVPSLVAPA